MSLIGTKQPIVNHIFTDCFVPRNDDIYGNSTNTT